MTAPHQADQLGRLIRPAEVLEAHEACTEGRIELNQLRESKARGPIGVWIIAFTIRLIRGFAKSLRR